jgi:hypothetical protein
VNEKNHGRYDAYQTGTSRPIPLVVVRPGCDAGFGFPQPWEGLKQHAETILLTGW